MTADKIVDEIRSLGGRLEPRGDRLHVEVPAGVLTPELREAIRSQKPKLLSLLRSNFDSEYTREELEKSRRRLVSKRVSAFRITSSVYGDIWIALTADAAQGLLDLNGVTVYEARYLIPLTTAEIRTLHDLRTIGGPGGSLEIMHERH